MTTICTYKISPKIEKIMYHLTQIELKEKGVD